MTTKPERFIRLENGVTLYPDRRAAPTLQGAARRKGLETFRAFVAIHPDGNEMYLIVDGDEPVFEHTSFEACASYIDAEYLFRMIP